MGIIVLLIAISVTIALLFLGIFIWVFKTGQYDDVYTPSVRMLFDHEKLTPSDKKPSDKKEKQSS